MVYFYFILYMELWLRSKKLYTSVALPPTPVEVTSIRESANAKDDNEVKLGAVYRSPGIYLKSEENRGRPQLGARLVGSLTYK